MVISVIGTRPQYIKYAAMDAEIRRRGLTREWVWIDSRQHYDHSVSGVFYDDFNLTDPVAKAPDTGIGFMLVWLEEIFVNLKPSMVVVYGDTNTTLVGALAAKRSDIPLAHVEAGRRANRFDLPEETNRVVADALADLKLDKAGNLHLEALKLISVKPPDDAKEYYLMDLHRNYNVDQGDRLKTALKQAEQLDMPVKFIMHHRIASKPKYRNLEVLSPQPYAAMIQLIKGAIKVITDSGGIQREAYQLRIPCITMRPSTEWEETLNGGCNVLVEPDEITKAVLASGTPEWGDLFEDDEAKRIIEAVEAWVIGD